VLRKIPAPAPTASAQAARKPASESSARVVKARPEPAQPRAAARGEARGEAQSKDAARRKPEQKI